MLRAQHGGWAYSLTIITAAPHRTAAAGFLNAPVITTKPWSLLERALAHRVLK
jgi:hypothetical protein